MSQGQSKNILPVYGVQNMANLGRRTGLLERCTKLSLQEKDHQGLDDQDDDEHTEGSSNVLTCVVGVGRHLPVIVGVRAGKPVSVPVGEDVEEAEEDAEEGDDAEHPGGVDEQGANYQDQPWHEWEEVLLLLLLDQHIAVGGCIEAKDDRAYEDVERKFTQVYIERELTVEV